MKEIIQSNPEINDLLNTLTLDKPDREENYKSIVAVNSQILTGLDKNRRELPLKYSAKYTIWYKPGILPIEGVIRIIQKGLAKIGHVDSEEIVLGLLSLYILYRDKSITPVKSLNNLLNRLVDTEVHLFYLFPRSVQNIALVRFKLNNFDIRELNEHHFKRWCKRAGSDYYDRYKDNLRGRICIHRLLQNVHIVNWHIFREKEYPPNARQEKMFGELYENYLERIQHHLFEQFYDDLLEEQHVLLAIGASYFNEQQLRLLSGHDHVAIFIAMDNQERVGGVISYKVSEKLVTIRMGGVVQSIPKHTKILQEEYGYTPSKVTPFHNVIREFSRYISIGIRHEITGNKNEAFLSMIIALDLLFGDSGQSIHSVSSRAAIVVHRRLGMTFEAQKAQLKNLYDERSKYVHEGKMVKTDSFDIAKKICQEVLFCLLRLQRDVTTSPPGVKEWLKNLDFLITAIIAGKEQSDSEYQENGIRI